MFFRFPWVPWALEPCILQCFFSFLFFVVFLFLGITLSGCHEPCVFWPPWAPGALSEILLGPKSGGCGALFMHFEKHKNVLQKTRYRAIFAPKKPLLPPSLPPPGKSVFQKLLKRRTTCKNAGIMAFFWSWKRNFFSKNLFFLQLALFLFFCVFSGNTLSGCHETRVFRRTGSGENRAKTI